MQATPDTFLPTLRELAAHPHDALFRTLISDPRRADALIRDHFPDSIGQLLTGSPARPGATGFAGPDLGQFFVDGLFEFGGLPGRPALVVVMEHKRTPGPAVVEQLALYALLAGRHYRDADDDPEVVPMLVSTGPAPRRPPWVGRRRAGGLSWLVKFPYGLECLWLAVAEAGYESLSRCPVVRAVLGALGCARVKPAPTDTLRKIFRDLATLPRNALLWEMTFSYGASMFGLEEKDYRTLVREADPKVSEARMATMYNDVMNEVLAVGRQEGQADLLLQLMRQRFGPVSADAEARVRAAPAFRLEAWGSKIFDAADLDDLLENGHMN